MTIPAPAPQLKLVAAGAALSLLVGSFLPWSLVWYVTGAAGLLFVALNAVMSVTTEKKRRHVGVDRRGLHRMPVRFRATLDWNAEDGVAKSLTVEGLDLSRMGATVVSRTPLARGSTVLVHIAGLQLTGIGHVRHSTPHGRKFHIGLEFKNPLMRSEAGTWTFASRPAQ